MGNNGKFFRRAAALLCAAAIAVSAYGLKPEIFSLPDSSGFSRTPESIAAELAADTGYAQALNNSESEDSESADDSSDSSRLPEDDSSDSGEEENGDLQSGGNTPDRGYYYSTYYTEISDGNGSDGSGSSGGKQASSQAESSDSTDSGSDSADGILADDGSRADTPGNDTTDGGETDTEYFTTDITDGETVTQPQFAFTVTHLKKELTVKRVQVSVNGSRVNWSGEVTLSEDNGGKNTVRISATYTDSEGKVISAYKTYTVYLKIPESEAEPQPQTPELKTDLYSQTRSNPELNFYAYVDGGAENVKLTVYLKNTRLSPSGSDYSCTLAMGLNKIRIKAQFTYEGESRELSAEYEIRLIAETTEDTAPYLAYHNVPETVRGTAYTLDLDPRDYNGNKLYYSNLYVRLNGSAISYKWDGEYTSYLLNLSAGENTLDIRVTDNEGRYTDFSFVITCLSAQNGEVIGYASMTVDADVLGLGDISPQLQIEIREGESAARSIVRALEECGFTVSGKGDLDEGYYIARLSKSGVAAAAQIDGTLYGYIENDPSVYFSSAADTDSLGEKDYTSASGWMITVNGHYTSYGTSDMHLKDGDVLRLRYTLAYGKDIGGYADGANYDICY